jgi:hypothetical protein
MSFDPQTGYDDETDDTDPAELCPHCNDWPCRCLFEQEELEYVFPQESDDVEF